MQKIFYCLIKSPINICCKSQYKNAQKSEYKNVQGSDIYSSGCASKKDRFSLRRYDGPLIETISE